MTFSAASLVLAEDLIIFIRIRSSATRKVNTVFDDEWCESVTRPAFREMYHRRCHRLCIDARMGVSINLKYGPM